MPGRSLGILACAGLALACSQPSRNGDTPVEAATPTFTLFALAEVRGQIEPCGCTTDPLGDISRTARLVAAARAKGPVIVVDAGSLLYSKSPVPPHLLAQEELKASLLATLYQDHLQISALGLGPMDLAGPGGTRLVRQVSNLATSATVPIAPPPVITAGAAKVGVFGVVAAAAAPGLAVTDPIAAGVAARDQLRKAGAQIVVALIQAPTKKDAVAIVRGIGPGVDVAVLGLGALAPEPEDVAVRAEEIDGTWIVIPANRGQVVSRVDVTVRPGGGALVDAVGAAAAATVGATLDARIAALDLELAAFATDPDADAAFVATRRQERAELAAERAALAKQPLQVPAKGSWFTLEQIRITKQLACDKAVNAAKTEYDRAAGQANLAAAAARPELPIKKGAATYVGTEACSDCHDDQVTFWAKTRHAAAWETLEERGKQLDYDCIGCHVTGWDRPGGATLANNEALRDVQCEVCHGPGSLHITAMSLDDSAPPTRGKMGIARAPEPELCARQCHTPEHSDTFAYDAYLRDIVGEGHGAERRAALGAGPTGHELRAAGLARAGASIGEDCRK